MGGIPSLELTTPVTEVRGQISTSKPFREAHDDDYIMN